MLVYLDESSSLYRLIVLLWFVNMIVSIVMNTRWLLVPVHVMWLLAEWSACDKCVATQAKTGFALMESKLVRVATSPVFEIAS